jgi:predicted DNA-binding protein with PD1-like motif
MVADIQYLTNANGKRHSVIVPIEEWNNIMEQLDKSTQKEQFKTHLVNAFNEVKEVQMGLKKPNTFSNFLENMDNED